MLFNSFHFMLFFPAVIFILFLIPKDFRWIWLLISSYYFYMSWNPKYILLIATSTAITWLCGILIAHVNHGTSIHRGRKKKIIVASSLICNLGILVFFKYSNFILDNAYHVLNMFHIQATPKKIDLLLPVGISFYIFQALGYTIDVYRDEIKPEKNLFKYALFVSFFPQLVAGPIERSKNLLIQLRKLDKKVLWDYSTVKNGFLLMLWGYFEKLVIADRAAIYVNEVYTSYTQYGCLEIAVATVLFSIQIYCDFDGYSNIARGAAEIMGIKLMKNFEQPYFAVNIKDFWRRWHISLSTWFRDYLYIPLGGSRKGKLITYINLMITFLVSGIWHGSSWNFIVWGGIHGLYQVIERIKSKNLKGKTMCANTWSCKIRKMFTTLCLVDFAWMAFRVDDMGTMAGMLRTSSESFSGLLFTAGSMSTEDWLILCLSIFLLIAIDIMHEMKLEVREILQRQEIWFRWGIYLLGTWGIIMFGVYGAQYDASQFIYFQF